METFPGIDELKNMPTLYKGWYADLKMEKAFTEYFADVRIWVERGDRTDGFPFDNTVTVEVREYLMNDLAGHWVELGVYDGANPPEKVGGYTATKLGL